MASPLLPVGPRDCAIGIAVPLDGNRFLLDLGEENRDYARYFRQMNHSKGATDEYYRCLYVRIADGFEQTLRFAEKRGVTVRRGITLRDLTSLFDGKTIVTIVTHWQVVEISEEDVLDAAAFLQLLRHPRELVHELVRAEFENRAPELLDPSTSADVRHLRARVATIVRDITNEVHAAYESQAAREHFMTNDVFVVPPLPALLLHRVTFEMHFDGTIRAAPSIELYDGMCTAPDFAARVPARFEGLLDLTVCHATFLGAPIKTLRPECLVAMGRYPVHLHIKMALYDLAIRNIAVRPQPWMNVLTKLARQASRFRGDQ